LGNVERGAKQDSSERPVDDHVSVPTGASGVGDFGVPQCDERVEALQMRTTCLPGTGIGEVAAGTALARASRAIRDLALREGSHAVNSTPGRGGAKRS
jgi:hypothetical protein